MARFKPFGESSPGSAGSTPEPPTDEPGPRLLSKYLTNVELMETWLLGGTYEGEGIMQRVCDEAKRTTRFSVVSVKDLVGRGRYCLPTEKCVRVQVKVGEDLIAIDMPEWQFDTLGRE